MRGSDPAGPGGGLLSTAVRELLGGAIDYAGLFPPAGLDLSAAAENYAAYRAGPDAWALGRFVAPAARLDELAAAVDSLRRGAGDEPWRVAALVGEDDEGDVAKIRAFAVSTELGALLVDVAELRATTPDEVARRVQPLPPNVTQYVEIPIDCDPAGFIPSLRQAGVRAKVRTGGVTQNAFPEAGALVRFLSACVQAELPFKATAGLHHPLAGRYHLTYEPNGPTGTMYGYLNLLVATGLLRLGASAADVAAALEDSDAVSFRLRGDGVTWREYRLELNDIRALRRRGMISFGSCSFREPLEGLLAMAACERGGASTIDESQ